jgi:predicted secreted protein
MRQLSLYLAALALLLSFVFLAGCAAFPHEGSSISSRPGYEFSVDVPTNPAVGYSWNVSVSNESVVRYVGYDSLFCVTPVRAGCNYIFKFKALQPGTASVYLAYLRPWENRLPASEKAYNVTVN